MKWIVYLLALLLSFTASASQTLSGTVTEYVSEEYILLETNEGNTIQVNFDSETEMPESAVDVGDSVVITYDGRMTRSIPAQIYAQSIAPEP